MMTIKPSTDGNSLENTFKESSKIDDMITWLAKLKIVLDNYFKHHVSFIYIYILLRNTTYFKSYIFYNTLKFTPMSER